METLTVFCTGCSWTRDWPKFLPSIEALHHPFDGKGVRHIHQQMIGRRSEDANRADRIVVQLPTPVRSVSQEPGNTARCLDYIKRVWHGQRGRKGRELLRTYQQEIEALAADFPDKLTFLIFNTGGYPFRCPYDFGEQVQQRMVEWLDHKGLPSIVVDFEGVSGYARKEFPRSDGEPKPLAPTIQPACGTTWIVDAHPNDAACRQVGIAVERHLKGRLV